MSRETEELLEAGRQLATVAERLRDHAPRAVDAALARWMVAVRDVQRDARQEAHADRPRPERVLASARRLRRAHHALVTAPAGHPVPSLTVAITDVVEAIAAHDEAETMSRLRAGRSIDVETEVRS